MIFKTIRILWFMNTYFTRIINDKIMIEKNNLKSRSDIQLNDYKSLIYINVGVEIFRVAETSNSVNHG